MRPLLLAALVLLVSLAVAACGGSGGGAATTGAARTSPTTAADTTPPKTTKKKPKKKSFQITVPASAPIGPTSPPHVIKELQKGLKMLGYPVGTPDGIWGEKTKKAVVKFQKDHHLAVDGLVGLKTAQVVNNALKKKA